MQILVDVDSSRCRFQQTWILVDVDSSRRGFQQIWILVDVRVYLSSILPRRSCCNWASPVIVPPLQAEGLKIIQFSRDLLFITFVQLYQIAVQSFANFIVEWTNQDFLSLGQKIAISLVKAVSRTNIFIVGLSKVNLTNQITLTSSRSSLISCVLYNRITNVITYFKFFLISSFQLLYFVYLYQVAVIYLYIISIQPGQAIKDNLYRILLLGKARQS